MRLERPALFSSRDTIWFALVLSVLLLFSLSYEYHRYTLLIQFDDAVVDAAVADQYIKSKEGREYHVLKIRMDGGERFYTTAPADLRDLKGYRLKLLLQAGDISFLEYMQGFFSYSRILAIYPERSAKHRLTEVIADQHEEEAIKQLFGALFAAAPMSSRLHETLSGLGISHLLAISGFHLGVLGFILYWLFYPLYKPFQNRFVPYRHGNRDLFLLVALFLFSYLAFLDFVPSLVRAFGMLIVGYVIYDRGMRVVSMQTLLIAVALLVAIWPRLAFSIGFWLSVGGVFSILLFLLHFSHWKKTWQFAGIHIWVYLMMLPISLHLFGHFTLYHSLSIIWTMLFILFYPLELLLHLAGLAGALDAGMSRLLEFGSVEPVSVEGYTVMAQVILGVAAIRYKKALLLLFGMVLAIFVGAVYQVA